MQQTANNLRAKKMRRVGWSILLMFGLLLSPLAGAVVINFDSLTTGSYSEAKFKTLFGATFDNTDVTDPDADAFGIQNVVSPDDNGATGLLRDFTALNAVANVGYDTATNRTKVTFDSPVDSVSVTMGDMGGDSDELHLAAYNSTNLMIGSVVVTDPLGDRHGYTLRLSGSDIKSIQFWDVGGFGSGNSAYWDNLTWQTGGSVPEPTTLVLVATAVVGAYASARKKKPA